MNQRDKDMNTDSIDDPEICEQPSSPHYLKHRRYRRRMQRDLQQYRRQLNHDQACDELYIDLDFVDPKRKEQRNPFDPSS